MPDFVGWVFIMCGREHDEVTQKWEKTSAKTGGVEEGGVHKREGVHKDPFPGEEMEEGGSGVTECTLSD